VSEWLKPERGEEEEEEGEEREGKWLWEEEPSVRKCAVTE